MKYLILYLFLAILASACNSATGPNDNKKSAASISVKNKTAMNDTTPKVTGIGGIFFGSKNPATTRQWYGKNLGLAINQYGSSGNLSISWIRKVTRLNSGNPSIACLQ